MDKNTPLYAPHWTDPRSKHATTLYGHEKEGLVYEYSDRLAQWNWTKHDEAGHIASLCDVRPLSVLWWEIYLTSYYDKRIWVEHVLGGANWSTGYPYTVLGYREE